MSKLLLSLWRSLSFARWSLRRRVGQFVPVAASFVLLVCAVQAIAGLGDVSSLLVQQQIARSWRASYDLLLRPQAAVSTPERGAGWIDPQSILETYGGINQQQIERIGSIAHVVQLTPVAMVGWQPVAVSVPVALPAQGIYRVSATWSNSWASDTVTHYVDVTVLTRLVQEASIANPTVEYLVPDEKATTYTLTLQAIEPVMGVSSTERNTISMLQQAQLQGRASTPAPHLLLQVERLRGGLSSLAGCVQRPSCWNREQDQQVQPGAIRYQVNGVQLLRYSRAQYAANAQQLAAGQVSLVPVGSDTQGLLYRVPMATTVAMPHETEHALAAQDVTAMPFSLPERSSFLPIAPRIIPLAEACAINGASCYSGVYVRLSGAERYSQHSLALLQATAAAITAQTGLHVDILDGSSLRTITFSTPQSARTAASVQGAWRVVGVAVQIVHGVDALQVVLLVLCSGVCLLSIAMAAVLVGTGRRKDALLLHQLGWQSDALVMVFLCDALALCAPGCLLIASWTIFASRVWPESTATPVIWMLIGVGVIAYCVLLVAASCWGRGSSKRSIQIVSNLAIVCAVFLLAAGYLLMVGFKQALVVTILGKQVQSVLAGPQLLLGVVIISAALLTVGFCSMLLLRGRREELQLLARIGWERQHVLLHVMRDCCLPATLSGAIGALMATGLAAMIASGLPSSLLVLSLLLCSPVLGVLLAGIATLGIAWQEIGRVFTWR